MITKMKKLTFLVYHKEYEEFLNSLRELGGSPYCGETTGGC